MPDKFWGISERDLLNDCCPVFVIHYESKEPCSCDNCCYSTNVIGENDGTEGLHCLIDFPDLRDRVLCDDYLAAETVEVNHAH